MPTTPRDATGVAEAIARFESEGYVGQLAAREDAAVLCFTCRAESPAAEVQLRGMIRTEGASDPDDMTAVAALVCPQCGAQGTVVLHFGPGATLEDADVLRELEDARGETGISADEPQRA